MEHKRKAGGSNAGLAEAEDRASKRRRTTNEHEQPKGETPESTTASGLAFLEQIRRTADKSGRLVSTYFEELPSRKDNVEYYKVTKMPISLGMVEQRLKDRDFANLTELESFIKRMIINAKDFYPRNSQVFEDAERVRKATSNYMTKNNPAYQTRGYQAQPTPLPPEDDNEQAQEAEADAAEDEAEGEIEAEAGEEDAPAEAEADAEAEEEEADVDAAGEEEEQQEAQDETADKDAEGEPEEEEEDEAAVAKPSIVFRRKSRGRSNNEYDGLTFQQAQEKLIDEMLNKKEDDIPYFEVFANMPPRSIKDYYAIIKEPISIRKLQKHVRGQHGRGEATGISDFKSWNQFEEKASLLWLNARQYNEDGSEIYELANELEEFFHEELNKAKKVVNEPPQPKIKLKVPTAQEATPGPKKIIIHAPNRGGSAESPALPAAPSEGTPASETPQLPNGTAAKNGVAPLPLAHLDRTRSVSASAASPNPSVAGLVKREDSRASPAAALQRQTSSTGFTPAQANGVRPAEGTAPNGVPQANGAPAWNSKYRRPGQDVSKALISNLKIQTHPGITGLKPEKRIDFDLAPHPREAQQCVAVNIPPEHPNNLKVQIIPTLPASLHDQQRFFKLWVLLDGQALYPSQPHGVQNLPPNSPIFFAELRAGANRVEVHVIAGLPGGRPPPPGEPEVELEVFTVLLNVLRG